MTTISAPVSPLHSPGPFTYERNSDGCDDLWTIVDATDREVASITFWDCDPAWSARALADVRLLTAAPELLETLKLMLRATSQLPHSGEPVRLFDAEQRAIAAIASVAGERTA